MKHSSEQVGELITALAKAQAEFGSAVKDSDNPYYGSKYADLAAVIGAVRPALNKHGIALMHTLESDLERQVSIVTVGFYCGEQFIEVMVEAPATGKGKDGASKFDVQTIGAAWSYLRRYTLQAICGLASEDDDGNSLQNDNKPIQKKGAAQATAEPAVPKGPFGTIPPDKLHCVVLGVADHETKSKKKYLQVVFNGRLEGFNYATCFDAGLTDALNAAKSKECILQIKYAPGDKFLNILDVLVVDGVSYVDGKPSTEVEDTQPVTEGASV